MTVTERERRRMELVDGSAHRTELCEQLAMREYELENLKDENAKLGMRVTSLESALDGMHLTREQDKAENAKLRELLQRTWDAFHYSTAREFAAVKNELRELGIEVKA